MNYKYLLDSIEKRPGFFLRNPNLDELSAFLGGVSYLNLSQGNSDQFQDFYANWFPRTFPECTHDWFVTLREMSDGKNEWELFFEIWKRYINESEQNSMDKS